MEERRPLLTATTGGSVPSVVARLRTSATSTTTATPTTTMPRTTGFARAWDCSYSPDSLADARGSEHMRKEGPTFGRMPVKTHPAGRAVRSLHGRELRRSTRFHCSSLSGLGTPTPMGAGRAGCHHE
nr:MAG TPA: hypothetical protein [Caudoviricetes sp.]